MNKVFKVIWSKTKNMYVVASEFAKSHTKSSRSAVISRTLMAGVLACVLSCGVVMPVMAYDASYDSETGVLTVVDPMNESHTYNFESGLEFGTYSISGINPNAEITLTGFKRADGHGYQSIYENEQRQYIIKTMDEFLKGERFANLLYNNFLQYYKILKLLHTYKKYHIRLSFH